MPVENEVEDVVEEMEAEEIINEAVEDEVVVNNVMVNLNMDFTVNLTWSNLNSSTHGVVSVVVLCFRSIH